MCMLLCRMINKENQILFLVNVLGKFGVVDRVPLFPLAYQEHNLSLLHALGYVVVL